MSLTKPNWRVTALVIGTAMLYAVLREHVVHGVSWVHLPLWTSNKALALAGVVMICFSYIASRMPNPLNWPRYFGLSGFGLSALHSVAALILLSAETYPNFYNPETGLLNFAGELSMLLGVLCFGCYALAAIVSLPGVKHAISDQSWLRWQRLGAWGLYLALGHVAAMGLLGTPPREWLHPSEWARLWIFPLPTISFVAAFVVLFTIPYRHFRHRGR